MIFRYRIARVAWGSRIIPRILQSSSIFARQALSLSPQAVRTLATTTLPPPSIAQSQAIKILHTSRSNILINACAGSGKTTTILHLAAASPDQNFLILVYNRRLMMETNERIGNLGLKNAVVYNYHTLGHRFYSPECDTDQGLKRIVRDKVPVMHGKRLPLCDVLVLDEQQDMTPILKTFIDKVVQDSGVIDPLQSSSGAGKWISRVRRVLLGDRRQELYGFNDADSRFLILAQLKELFGNGEGWETITQDISYRLTEPNAKFINKQILKPIPGGEIASIKDKASDGSAFPKPRYVFYEPLGHGDIKDYRPYKEVLRLLNKMDHSDILVLAPSLKCHHFIDLANCLALKGHPVLAPDFEDSQGISLSQSRGKIALCTYHQSKGIEREAAVSYGFDESYNLYYAKTSEPPPVAGNPQYVAATRAKTDLVVLINCDYDYPSFIDRKTLEDTCEIVNREIHSLNRKRRRSIQKIGVSALTRNVHSRVMSECIQELELEQISPAYWGSSPPSEIGIGGGLVEGVANITGAAVPAIYEYYTKRKYGTGAYRRLTSFDALFQRFEAYNDGSRERRAQLFKRIQDDRPEINDHLRMVMEKMAAGELEDGDILFLANFSMAIESKLLVKLLSIPLDRYSWVKPKHTRDMISILSPHIPSRCQFERSIHCTFSGSQLDNWVGANIWGRLDISDLDNKWLVEVKYTQELRVEHILQTALYGGLAEAKGKSSTCKLINVMSGEIIGIKPKTEDSYENIFRLLVNARNTESAALANLTDEEFIKEAGNAFENYIGPVVLPSWFGSRKITRSRKSTTIKDATEPSAKGLLTLPKKLHEPAVFS
ncbi:P-loop containing nucleoside triphosphate hydrolase protein [Tuber brumale]|nr:P-loop containing nucleoside triphosphate hydrolase protein [Tuber brumale]